MITVSKVQPAHANCVLISSSCLPAGAEVFLRILRIQAIGYPAALFRAAQAAHETLRLRLGPMDMPSSAGLPSTSAEPSSLAISPHEEIHHGMLPEALSLMLGGHVSLRSSRAEQVVTGSLRDAADSLPNTCW